MLWPLFILWWCSFFLQIIFFSYFTSSLFMSGRVSNGTARCPGTKTNPCPAVPLSQDKGRGKNPGTNSCPAKQNCPVPLETNGVAYIKATIYLCLNNAYLTLVSIRCKQVFLLTFADMWDNVL
jgi:hypothetical protein